MRKGRALGTMVGALGLLVAGGGLSGCDVGNSPVRGGTSALDFGLFENVVGRGEQPVVRLQLFLASPFFHWDFRDTALIGNRLAPGTGTFLGTFDLARVSLGLRPFAQYTSDHAYWEQLTERREIWRQHEVVLFARDPVEMSRMHRGLVHDNDHANPSAVPARWRDEWRAERIPDARTMWYPPQKGWDTVWDNGDPNRPPQPVLARLGRHDFWGGNTPEGPGALPDGEGSIKAAKVYDHGLCGMEMPFVTGDPNNLGLLEQIAKLVPEFIAKDLMQRSSTHKLERRWLHVAPYLDFTTHKEDAQLGGFFLNMNLQFQVIFDGGPNLTLHGAHAFQLFEGRLTVAGDNLYMASSGTGSEEAKDSLMRGLYRVMDRPLRPSDRPRTMAEAIFQEADKLQVYRADVGSYPCTERAPADETVEASSNGECSSLVQELDGHLAQATNNLSQALGLTAEERAQLRDENMLGTRIVGGTTVYKNIRCAAPPHAPDIRAAGVCEYVLPAKRLLVLPNAVKLVFIDDKKEISNPAYPIWLHALDAARFDIRNYEKLCGSFVEQVPGTTFARPFPAVKRDFVRYLCANPPACTQIIEETTP
jgi:hypothetical protein